MVEGEAAPGATGSGATPLGLLVAGMLLVVLDFRVDGIDVVPDVIGWTIVLLGLGRLSARHRWFTSAAWGACAAGLFSLLALTQEPGPWVSTAHMAMETLVVFGTCSGIRGVSPDAGVRATAERLRWLDLGIVLAALAFEAALGEWGGARQLDGGGAVVLVVLVVAAFAVLAWFLVFCWSHRGDADLRPRPVARV